MDRAILGAVLFCCRLLVRQGVDFDRLKIIAETKLLMDRRRVYLNWRQQQQKENSNPLLVTQIVYLLLGLFAGMFVFAFQSLPLSMILVHSYVLFMMTMTMITDFSSVLLDTTDNQIILPKPVNSKTLFVARLVHILVYLLQFTVALALFPVIFIFVKFGVAVGVGSIITMLLTATFAVFITYLLYAIILRFGNEQKIKDIVGYFQILMTIFFAVGFQIIPRLIDFDNLSASFTLHTYSYFLPPVWMALALEAIHEWNFDTLHIVMTLAAILIPLFTFWLMISWLAPAFSNKLAALSNDSAGRRVVKSGVTIQRPISERLSALCCPARTEQAGFELTWKITGRDKLFKMQFYPSLAYLLVFIFVIVFRSGQDVGTAWEELGTTQKFLVFIYLPMLSIPSAILFISYYEHFLASWIYQSAPVTKPGLIISGALKVLLVKFFIPLFVAFFGFALWIWGPAIIDDFVLGFLSNTAIFLVIANIAEKWLPFSRQQNAKQQVGRFVQMLIQMLVIGALVGLHVLVLKTDWLIYCLIPLVAAGCFFLLRRIQNLKWSQISF